MQGVHDGKPNVCLLLDLWSSAGPAIGVGGPGGCGPLPLYELGPSVTPTPPLPRVHPASCSFTPAASFPRAPAWAFPPAFVCMQYCNVHADRILRRWTGSASPVRAGQSGVAMAPPWQPDFPRARRLGPGRDLPSGFLSGFLLGSTGAIRGLFFDIP